MIASLSFVLFSESLLAPYNWYGTHFTQCLWYKLYLVIQQRVCLYKHVYTNILQCHNNSCTYFCSEKLSVVSQPFVPNVFVPKGFMSYTTSVCTGPLFCVVYKRPLPEHGCQDLQHLIIGLMPHCCTEVNDTIFHVINNTTVKWKTLGKCENLFGWMGRENCF